MNTVNDVNVAKAPCFLLTLDADGVYWGATQIHPDDVNEGDVVLDHAPDNAPGKYKWDRVALALAPLPLSQQKEAQGAPDLERAFESLCEYLSDGNAIPLPALVTEWRAAYRKTIDRQKTVD